MKALLAAVALVAALFVVMPSAGAARHDGQAPQLWHAVPAPSVASLAVKLRNHLNGILASKCQSTYTRNLAGTSLRVWTIRHIAAHRAKNACVDIRDWRSAVMYVQRWFPGTAAWLLSCSSSEGGHGGWVPNRNGSGAGGWMQYMSGTFYSDFDSAIAYLSQRGVRVAPSARSWYSPLGQAIAAGWARYTGHTPPGKWTGGGC